MNMNNNTIVVIDSSDDDCEPAPKRRNLRTSSTSGKKISHLYDVDVFKIGTVKSLAANVNVVNVKDVVVIDDEEESPPTATVASVAQLEVEEDPLEIKNSEISEKSEEPKKENKRVELTPVLIENTSDLINSKRVEVENTDLIDELIEPSTSEVQENGVSSSTNGSNTITELTEEFQSFLDACKSCDCELVNNKLTKLEEKYREANDKYVKSSTLKQLLLTNIAKIKHKPANIILYFSEVYRELVAQKKRTIELTDKDISNLDKLQSVLKKIKKKINKLEKSECDFDEESNSSYLMLDRYKKRATLIYNKICSYTKDNPYASRQLYKNLDISCSKYSEINRAVDKLYSKNKQFPSFYDVDRCVRKCVKQNNLIITDAVLTFEINKMFKHVGDLLKRRRKLETYESINDLVEPMEEETQDPELEKMLDIRHIENEKRIDAVLEKYVSYQEEGKNPTISSDSDDSKHESEESSDE